MVVPVDSHMEIEDFAETLGFRISEGARKAINAYVDAKSPPVKPTAPDVPEMPDPEAQLAEILGSSAEIIKDLYDYPEN